MNKRNPPSLFYDLAETSTATTPAVGPTIIRPQSSRKPKPPRPPPPKINGQSGARQPPSYDDVFGAEVDAFGAEVDAFIGEMRAPRQKIRAPPRPAPVATSGSNSRQQHHDDANATPLIQFDDFPSTSSSYVAPRLLATNSAPAAGFSLLDLDNDFFMQAPWSGATTAVGASASSITASAPAPVNRPLAAKRSTTDSGAATSLTSTANGIKLGTRVLPLGPIPSLHSVTPASQSNWSRASWTAQRSEVETAAAPTQHPSQQQQLSKGDDWLQSCLQGSNSAAPKTPAKSGGGAVSPFGKGGSSWAGSNSSVPQWNSTANPPLPPRPRNVCHSDGSLSPTQSPEPPSATPPPVPPLPFSDLDSHYDDDAKFDVPPLPPRPKNYETMRPHAIAIYDYDATQPDELSFKCNNIITLIHRVDESWLYGYTDDCEGIFPQTFVNIVVPLADEKGTLDISGPRCLALYDFTAETESELSLCAGDVIVLDRKDSNEWFHGTLNGKSGVFPATFVEVVEDLPANGDALHKRANQSASTKLDGNLHVAIYDFRGESGELTFSEGSLIDVTGSVNEEWMRGHLIGSTTEGHFPKSFVEKLNK